MLSRPCPASSPKDRRPGSRSWPAAEDLLDSTVTLMSYSAAGGPREVLLATVTEAAEAKLIEALGVSDQNMVPVQVEVEMTGRLPLDEQQQLHEKVAKAAKSVNHKLKQGQAIPDQTAGYYQEAKSAVQAVLDDPDASGDEKAMAAHYAVQLETVAERIYGTPGPVRQGRQDPDDRAVPDNRQGYRHQVRTGSRRQPGAGPAAGGAADREPDPGRASTRPPVSRPGTECPQQRPRQRVRGRPRRQLDRGVPPYAANDPSHDEYSLRGQLEIHAPQGGGTARTRPPPRPAQPGQPAAHRRRRRVDIPAREHHSPGPGQPQARRCAVDAAQAMEELQLQEIFHERQHELAGLDETALQGLARDLQLEAAARCLPKKVTLVRDAIAQLPATPMAWRSPPRPVTTRYLNVGRLAHLGPVRRHRRPGKAPEGMVGQTPATTTSPATT